MDKDPTIMALEEAIKNRREQVEELDRDIADFSRKKEDLLDEIDKLDKSVLLYKTDHHKNGPIVTSSKPKTRDPEQVVAKVPFPGSNGKTLNIYRGLLVEITRKVWSMPADWFTTGDIAPAVDAIYPGYSDNHKGRLAKIYLEYLVTRKALEHTGRTGRGSKYRRTKKASTYPFEKVKAAIQEERKALEGTFK